MQAKSEYLLCCSAYTAPLHRRAFVRNILARSSHFLTLSTARIVCLYYNATLRNIQNKSQTPRDRHRHTHTHFCREYTHNRLPGADERAAHLARNACSTYLCHYRQQQCQSHQQYYHNTRLVNNRREKTHQHHRVLSPVTTAQTVQAHNVVGEEAIEHTHAFALTHSHTTPTDTQRAEEE